MGAAPPRATPAQRFTIYDLDQFPDDGRLRELVDGQIVEWDVTTRLHGYFMAVLARLLGNFVADANLGVILTGDPMIRIQGSEHNARGPDLCFYARGRIPHDLTAPVGEEPPDFVVEILSPGDRAGEVQRKIVDWLGAGVKLLWYVDPEGGFTTVYHAGGITSVGPDRDLDGADVLPGFRLRLRAVYDQISGMLEESEEAQDASLPPAQHERALLLDLLGTCRQRRHVLFYRNVAAGEGIGLAGSQEDDEAGAALGWHVAAFGEAALEALRHFGHTGAGQPFRHRRAHNAGMYAEDAHPLAIHLDRQVLRQPLQGRLAHCVGRHQLPGA